MPTDSEAAEQRLRVAAEIGALAIAGWQSMLVEAGAYVQANIEAGQKLLRGLYEAGDARSLAEVQVAHLRAQIERNLSCANRLTEVAGSTADRIAEKARLLAPSSRD